MGKPLYVFKVNIDLSFMGQKYMISRGPTDSMIKTYNLLNTVKNYLKKEPSSIALLDILNAVKGLQCLVFYNEDGKKSFREINSRYFSGLLGEFENYTTQEIVEFIRTRCERDSTVDGKLPISCILDSQNNPNLDEAYKILMETYDIKIIPDFETKDN